MNCWLAWSTRTILEISAWAREDRRNAPTAAEIDRSFILNGMGVWMDEIKEEGGSLGEGGM